MSNGKKRKVSLNNRHKEEFPHIIAVDDNPNLDNSIVKCKICGQQFSIGNKGRQDIIQHNNTKQHKTRETAAASSSKMTFFLRSHEFHNEEKQLALHELVFSYHQMMHNHSFRSMDCTNKLIRTFYNKKFSCARTKSNAIIRNVLFPSVKDELMTELGETNYVTILSDASNHKAQKMYPIAVRYFHKKYGVQVKLLNLSTIEGETSEIVSSHMIEIIKTNNLENKVVGISADNTNLNFGGLRRRGKQNVFCKIKTYLGRNIFGIGCNAHIVSNAINTANHKLPIDVTIIIPQIYLYFRNYTVRTEALKRFCDEDNVDFKILLGYSATRWLALLKAVERILLLYQPLKSYFLSQDVVPQILLNFFSNEVNPIYLEFIHNQAVIFQDAILKLESQCLTAMEAIEILNELKNQVKFRLDNTYFPLILRSKISVLEESEPGLRKKFENHIKDFYKTALMYLEEWTMSLKDANIFCWTLLKKKIELEKVFSCLMETEIQDKVKIDDSKLVEEIRKINIYCDETRLEYWRKNSIQFDKRWVEIFLHFEKESISIIETMKIIQIAFSLPGTNAAVERIFSLINDIWTPEKSNISIKCLEAIVTIKCNINKTCNEFAEYYKSNDAILKKVHESKKYNDSL